MKDMNDLRRVYAVLENDNVATALADIPVGSAKILGSISGCVEVREPISPGHKVALCDIPADGEVIKYGAVIGKATVNIAIGDWVHLHNIRSLHDTRSGGAIDPVSGKVLDTRYD